MHIFRGAIGFDRVAEVSFHLWLLLLPPIFGRLLFVVVVVGGGGGDGGGVVVVGVSLLICWLNAACSPAVSPLFSSRLFFFGSSSFRSRIEAHTRHFLVCFSS
jgi:hypothetical protein